MSKYIIKNCPAFVLMRTATSGTYFNMCGNAKGHIKCQDCTDCLIKQVIEKCKEVYLQPEELDEIKKHQEYLCKCSHHNMAADILQLFDIKECE